MPVDPPAPPNVLDVLDEIEAEIVASPALPVGERQKNLDTLKFIARETGARGLEFQLGLWTHAWQWTDSPKSDHVITGLETGGKVDWAKGAAYSRDALAILARQRWRTRRHVAPAVTSA